MSESKGRAEPASAAHAGIPETLATRQLLEIHKTMHVYLFKQQIELLKNLKNILM